LQREKKSEETRAMLFYALVYDVYFTRRRRRRRSSSRKEK
jgi:hypothetical protein